MSDKLLAFAKEFLASELDPIIFADEYIRRWKQEGRAGLLAFDEPGLNEALSTIFCFADMFNPDDDRDSSEFDEARLRLEIENELDQKGLL